MYIVRHFLFMTIVLCRYAFHASRVAPLVIINFVVFDLKGGANLMYLVWATCACMTATLSGSTWNKIVSHLSGEIKSVLFTVVSG